MFLVFVDVEHVHVWIRPDWGRVRFCFTLSQIFCSRFRTRFWLSEYTTYTMPSAIRWKSDEPSLKAPDAQLQRKTRHWQWCSSSEVRYYSCVSIVYMYRCEYAWSRIRTRLLTPTIITIAITTTSSSRTCRSSYSHGACLAREHLEDEAESTPIHCHNPRVSFGPHDDPT